MSHKDTEATKHLNSKSPGVDFQIDDKNDKNKLINVLKVLNKEKGIYFMFSNQSLSNKIVNVVDNMNEDVEITNETAYFLINDNEEFNKATKTSFTKAFPGSEEKIGAYLKQNKVDFNKQADLQKLFQFCVAQN